MNFRKMTFGRKMSFLNLKIRRSSLVAIIWFDKRRKNHWRYWPLFRNGMLFITLTNSVQLKSAEICFGLTSLANWRISNWDKCFSIICNHHFFKVNKERTIQNQKEKKWAKCKIYYVAFFDFFDTDIFLLLYVMKNEQ